MKYVLLISLLNSVFSGSTPAASTSDMAYDYTESNWPETCKVGKKQTPVDLDMSSVQIIKNNSIISILSNTYTPINTGSLQNYYNTKFGLDLTGKDTLWVLKGGIPYQYFLLGFHVHFASEHTVQSKSMDLELHLVHGKNKNYTKMLNITDPDTNDYLVVGIMFKSSPSVANNTILQSMNWGSKTNITGLDLSSYVLPTKNFYHYSGSLTTPDCVEKVNWVVMDQVETMSVDQFSEIRNWIQTVYPKGNARATKPLYGRTIYYIQNSQQFFLTHAIAFTLLLALFFIVD
jgi:carbonic anhydrase